MSDDVLVLQSENSVLLLPVIDPQVLLLVGNGGSGPAGAPGPPGPPGGAQFIFTQVTPSGSWVINHNLGSLVHVTVLNTAGTIVDADVVETSINTVTISFNTPQAGTAVISP